MSVHCNAAMERAIRQVGLDKSVALIFFRL